jgi:hypothetical protein
MMMLLTYRLSTSFALLLLRRLQARIWKQLLYILIEVMIVIVIVFLISFRR